MTSELDAQSKSQENTGENAIIKICPKKVIVLP